jgi:hypothetical protein
MDVRDIFYMDVLLKFVETFIFWLKSVKVMESLLEDMRLYLHVPRRNSCLIH